MKPLASLVNTLLFAASVSEGTVIEPRGMAKVNEYRYGDWYFSPFFSSSLFNSLDIHTTHTPFIVSTSPVSQDTIPLGMRALTPATVLPST